MAPCNTGPSGVATWEAALQSRGMNAPAPALHVARFAMTSEPEELARIVRSLLEITRLTTVMALHATRQEAIAAWG
jgi:hypothetical protein